MLKSHFCIKLFGTFQDSNNVYFALELAAGGELFRRLSKKESFKPPGTYSLTYSLTLTQLQNFMQQKYLVR
jgi:serine/threonine protein kinase